MIKITQVPKIRSKIEDEASWLCDPFANSRVYGTKFTLKDRYFSWKFFLKEESKEDAFKNGYQFLDYLREIYPGLSGEVKVKPIDFKQINKQKLLLELTLPKPFFNKQINLFKKIINLFTFNKNHVIKIYILWQKDDSLIGEIKGTELETEYKLDENFKIKIYLSLVPKFDNNIHIEDQKAELKGHLEYLTTEIANIEGETATLTQVSPDTWKQILNGRVFWKNLLGVDTGRFYRGIIDQIPEDKIPGFVSPKVIDFTIPEYFLLDKAITVRNENISFLQKSNQKEISLGYYISRGVKTHKKVNLSINDLVHHTFISGLTGSGKTTFLNQIQQEISIKYPNCGILIIGMRKKDEDIPYNLDITLRYGDQDFRVPYYFKGENIEVTLEQLAALLASSLGLKQPVDIIMYNAMIKYFEKNKDLPDTLEDLFGKLLNWFKNYPYHRKYQTNITNAIKNRALRWSSSPILKNITRLPSIKPFWFMEWINGKNIYIDLSKSICNDFIKKLLINLIFQMIRIFFPQIRKNKLKNLIILDEIGVILKKPATTVSNDDEFVSQYFFEEVFSDFLEAFRSRGIGLILTAQKPSQLFESVYSLPSILILFRTAHSCSNLFTNDREEQDTLAIFEARRAIVIDGVNGRKFAIYTKDFNYKNFSNHPVNRIQNLCPSCKNYIKPYDNFCSVCGNSLNLDSKSTIDKSDIESTKLKENN